MSRSSLVVLVVAALALVAAAIGAACQAAPCDGCPGTLDAGMPADGAILDAGPPMPDSAAFFACGAEFCQFGVEYCRHVQGGAPPGVDNMACATLPEGGSCSSIRECTCTEDA